MEESAKPLVNAGKLQDLDKLLDHALEMLGETATSGDMYRRK